MKPLEVWTCQRTENLKKKSSKITKNNYAATMVSAARRQIIGGGDGGAPINKSRRGRRPQIVGGGAARRGRRTALIQTSIRLSIQMVVTRRVIALAEMETRETTQRLRHARIERYIHTYKQTDRDRKRQRDRDRWDVIY